MKNAKIIASGMYVPDQILPNAYFNELLGEDVDTWLRENVQIYERRWCKENESTADLCHGAASEALQNAGLKATEIDLIIVATDTPEYISPSTAAVLQHRLGAKNAGTFDLNAACAGFVTATETATHYIRSGSVNNVLVVGAYAMSKYLNKTDKKTVTLFADGAGAVVLTATDEKNKGHQTGKLISQGQYTDWMGIYGGGTKNPISDKVLQQKDHKLKFVKKFPPELNPNMWSGLAKELAGNMNIDIGEVAQFFITQININAIKETLRILDVDQNKAHTVMHHYGYTGSACIPMAFHEAWEQRKVKEGDTLFFIGSGGGLAFAANAFIL
ncbi:3-oxoacyl-ACP synthase III family protein [Pseudozobellia thermophila]|uniref:3-oxoacyl-[acyl-carrier-protein] synthase-3 n=1 Tax=Pseudozobellia thermophila TaxID=192903 RepID=A0A1M6C944_9FLAO|nr:ketoacyl-ACP synthase III [Pseudozobellia thermophila]SHI57542.1 3-oxoacyl-[acyl-carrier-protein] synthase-3 [Pseudozobellia thermophila]